MTEGAPRRLAIRYLSTLKIAHECARSGSGRVGERLHAEAFLINEVCQALLGAEAWNQIVEDSRAAAIQ